MSNLNISTCPRTEIESMSELEKQCHAHARLQEMLRTQCPEFVEQQRHLRTHHPATVEPNKELSPDNQKLHDRLHELFLYHPDGLLIRKVRAGTRGKRGTIACVKKLKASKKKGSSNAYRWWVKVDSKSFPQSRLVWLFHGNDLPIYDAKGCDEIDHIIEGNSLDDRIENLQLVPNASNMRMAHNKNDFNAARMIRDLCGRGKLSQTTVGSRFRIEQSQVSRIVRDVQRKEDPTTLASPNQCWPDHPKDLKFIVRVEAPTGVYTATPEGFAYTGNSLHEFVTHVKSVLGVKELCEPLTAADVENSPHTGQPRKDVPGELELITAELRELEKENSDD